MKKTKFTLYAVLLLIIVLAISVSTLLETATADDKKDVLEITGKASTYTVQLNWDKTLGGPFEVIIASDSNRKNVVVQEKNVQGGEFRAALCPDQEYWCEVRNENRIGNLNFRTEAVLNRYGADVLEIYESARPNSHWAGGLPPHYTEPLPVDENLPISPWYRIKEYYGTTPPSFTEIRDRLPIPIFDGEENQDLIEAYWYAWSVAFDEWLFEPTDKSQTLTNLCGYPNWGAFGSTMDYDTFFIIQYARYANGAYPYITVLDNLYARQHNNGRIHKETGKDGFEVYSSAPAMTTALAWAEWENYRVTGDKGRLNDIILPLVKLYEWFQRYQRFEDGRYFSEQGGHGDWSMTAIAFQALSARAISDMAGEIGRKDLQKYFLTEYKDISDMVNNEYWDEGAEYYNFRLDNGEYMTRYKPGETFKYMRSFDVLMANIAPKDRADSMILNQLLNPGVFMGEYGVRTLSLDSTLFIIDIGGDVIPLDTIDISRIFPNKAIAEEEDYIVLVYNTGYGDYRFMVWAPDMVTSLHSLFNYGYRAEARDLAERYARGIAKSYKNSGDIKEFAYVNRAEMGGAPRFCGWSGYGPIACLIEAILGFEVDAPNKTVYWDIHQTARHGIQQLHFGGITADFLCDARTSQEDQCRITVTTDKPFTLVLKDNGKTMKTYEIQKGTSHHIR